MQVLFEGLICRWRMLLAQHAAHLTRLALVLPPKLLHGYRGAPPADTCTGVATVSALPQCPARGKLGAC